MHPTVDLFVIELPVYTTLVLLGGIVGVVTAYLYLHYRRVAGRRRFLDAVLVVLSVAGLGARAYHVGSHWDYYAARPEEIPQLGLGGLAMRGAFLAGLGALVVYAHLRRVSFWSFADASVLGLSLGQALGWGGALAHGVNAGRVSAGRLALDLPDVYGLIEPRVPLQHIEIIFFIGLFIVLLLWAQRTPCPGTLFLVYLFVNAFAQFILGTQRGDETVRVGAWRFDQLLDVALVMLALALLVKHARHLRSESILHVKTH